MERQPETKAIVSLVLGILSILTPFLPYVGIVGLVCGIIAIIIGMQARRENPSSMATAGFICGIIGTCICSFSVIVCGCIVGGLASLMF